MKSYEEKREEMLDQLNHSKKKSNIRTILFGVILILAIIIVIWG